MITQRGTAGARIEPGTVVYQEADGKIYPWNHSGRWRRLLEWLHIVKRRKPVGIVLVLGKAVSHSEVEICISDTQFHIPLQ